MTDTIPDALDSNSLKKARLVNILASISSTALRASATIWPEGRWSVLAFFRGGSSKSEGVAMSGTGAGRGKGAGVSLSNLTKRLWLVEGGAGGGAVDGPGTGDGERFDRGGRMRMEGRTGQKLVTE